MPPVALKDFALRLAYNSAVEDGRLSVTDIKRLKAAAVDGGRITNIERQDLATIASKHKLSPTAAKIWADSFGGVAPVQPAAPEERSSIYVRPEESRARWEGYVHYTPAPHWRFETWSHRGVPDYSPQVTEVRQGNKRFLEFAGTPKNPRGRVEITHLQATTFHLGGPDFSGESWRVKLEPQTAGLPWKATLTREQPGGLTGPNSRRHLGTTSTWTMFIDP